MDIATKESKSITSVLKAVDVLDLISRSENGLGVTEISQGLNYGVSATYHLLNTLRQCKMLEQDKKTKKYRIGFAMFRISNQAKKQNLLGGLTMSHLERLRDELSETANLSMLEGSDIVCIAQVESGHMIRLFSRPGSSSPFYFTAGGKLLVACQPRESWDGYISKVRFEKYTGNTILSINELRDELEETLRRGYGVDNEEREEGVVCIAAPVFDAYGEAIAAMSISGPAYRIGDRIDEIGQKIKEAAGELSKSIGYNPESVAK